jgi:hypothetical protein
MRLERATTLVLGILVFLTGLWHLDEGRGDYVTYLGQHMPALIAMATGGVLILAATVAWRFLTRR